MLYLNNPLLTTQSITQYFETEVFLKAHDASSLKPSPLLQFQNKLKAIFFDYLDKRASHEEVLAALAVDERFTANIPVGSVSNYPHLKHNLGIIFSLTAASDQTQALAALKAYPMVGADWTMQWGRDNFIQLNTRYGYFDQDSEMCMALFFKLAIATRIMIVLFEKNNTHEDTMAYQYAYKLMALFAGSSCIDDVEKTFKLISDATHKLLSTSDSCKGKPFHDVLLVQVVLPMANEVHDLAGWRALIKKEGEKVLPYFEMAKKIEAKLAEQSNEAKFRAPKTLQESTTIAKLCHYSRAISDPEFAVMCAQYNISEGRFNACLDYMVTGWPKKITDSIPALITKGVGVIVNGIDAAAGFYWLKLPVTDKRALILGKITHCCQSLGSDASSCVKDAVSLSDNGLYVLLKQKKKTSTAHPMLGDVINDADFDIVGQSYVWKSQTGNLCLDSIEFGLNVVTPSVLKQILTDFATQLLKDNPSIKRVTIGRGGNTPEGMFSPTLVPEIMRQGFSYGDADDQYCIATTLYNTMTQTQATALQACLNNETNLFRAQIEYLSDYIADVDAFIRELPALLQTVLSPFRSSPKLLMRLFMFSQTFTLNDLKPVEFNRLGKMSPEKRAIALSSISLTQLMWRENTLNGLLRSMPYVNPSQRLEVVKAVRSILYQAINDGHCEQVMAILNLLCISDRLVVAKLMDGKKTLLHLVVNHPQALKNVLSWYPASERLDAVNVNIKYGVTLLHRVAGKPKSLAIVLNLYPQSKRLDVVEATDDKGHSVLHYSARAAQSLTMILKIYPKSKRLEAVKKTDMNGFNALFYASKNPAALSIILNLYLPSDRLEAVKVTNKEGYSALYYIVKHAESLVVLLRSLPESERLDAVKVDLGNGCNALDVAESRPKSLVRILNLYPASERLAAMTKKDYKGRSVAKHGTGLLVLLKLLPVSDRFNVIQNNSPFFLSTDMWLDESRKFVNMIKHIVLTDILQEEKAYPARKPYLVDVKKGIIQADTCEKLAKVIPCIALARRAAFLAENWAWLMHILRNGWIQVSVIVLAVMVIGKHGGIAFATAISVGSTLARVGFFGQDNVTVLDDLSAYLTEPSTQLV